MINNNLIFLFQQVNNNVSTTVYRHQYVIYFRQRKTTKNLYSESGPIKISSQRKTFMKMFFLKLVQKRCLKLVSFRQCTLIWLEFDVSFGKDGKYYTRSSGIIAYGKCAPKTGLSTLYSSQRCTLKMPFFSFSIYYCYFDFSAMVQLVRGGTDRDRSSTLLPDD